MKSLVDLFSYNLQIHKIAGCEHESSVNKLSQELAQTRDVVDRMGY